MDEQAALFEEYRCTGDVRLRNRLLEQYLYLAGVVAAKFSGRGVEYDDLYQVASVALVKAMERYEPGRGVKFTSFAMPSLIGEVKNYFRDKSRLMHVSRRQSEQIVKLQAARDALGQDARVKDIAQWMDTTEEHVLELLETQQAAAVTSLEKLVGDGEAALADFLGREDAGFQEIDNHDFLKKAIGRLDGQERTILKERFWNGLSQKQVAEKLGVSQMHISRQERRILKKMRDMDV